MNLVDFVGIDWYSYNETLKDNNGLEYTAVVYKYTDAKSQDELDKRGVD